MYVVGQRRGTWRRREKHCVRVWKAGGQKEFRVGSSFPPSHILSGTSVVPSLTLTLLLLLVPPCLLFL